ncbi:hypothetical protein BJX99DRAFT_247569 [Aspergillus californicus]
MDPLSATAGAIGIVDICFRLIKFLKDLPATIAAVQAEIDTWITEIESLQTTAVEIDEALESHNTKSSKESRSSAYRSERLRHKCKQQVEKFEDIAKRLQTLVQEIHGSSGPRVTGSLDGLGKEKRRRGKLAGLQRLRTELSAEKQNLQILLSCFNMHDARESKDKLDRVYIELHNRDQSYERQIQELRNNIRWSNRDDQDEDEQDIAALYHLRKSLQSVATDVQSVTVSNKFFDSPQPVESFYTGRTQYLDRLHDVLLNPEGEQVQKQMRFVICGIGGSGKTQFVSRFAELNRESFWGVFCIDASTHERIKQTYAEIAKMGKVEPNQNAAMHWLSNRKERWLLLIDNADDPGIRIQEYFPKGDRGYIIITTRNPEHKIHGNVGPNFFEFHGMEEDDSSALLLRRARLAEPWDDDSSSRASKIARKLGFLALALIQAGAAIGEGSCTLTNYLTFYDEQWKRIRRTAKTFLKSNNHDLQSGSALTTYEISYRAIKQRGTESSEDAVQLLSVFSFFHNQNIRFDILRKAVVNCAIEKDGQENRDKEEALQPVTWYQRYKNIQLSILAFIMEDRGPSILPSCIQKGQETGSFDGIRVRYALRELAQMSLIMHDESNDSYSMHPVVHRWARERHGVGQGEKAVWSHIAAVILGHSVLLPPRGETEADEIFRRDILPHIDHVRSCQEAIESRIMQNRKGRWGGLTRWPRAGSRFDRAKAIRYAKFSFVLAQNGRLGDAEVLQLAVKSYTDRVLGLGHSAARRITLALAQTYWHQGRGDEAAELQDAVLQACMKSLGPDSHETLTVRDILGQTRWQQGRYSEAKVLQERAVEGLIKLKGRESEDVLIAMKNLGRTNCRFYENLDEAKQLLTGAMDGMINKLGATHLETLSAKEEVAMLALQMKEDLTEPLRIVEQVFDCRKEKLGKENPYTLLAMLNLAKIKTALGQHIEAEALVRMGLSIADRNLGEDHIGTLVGRTVLATILTKQSKLGEAESVLLNVIEKQRHLSAHRGDFHPDRLGAMMELAACYRLQGRLDESIQYCDAVIEGLKKISLKQHPLERLMRAQKSELIEMKRLREDEGQP